jgi:DNA replication protein DnaC
MQSITALTAGFSIPQLTADEWAQVNAEAAEFDRQREKAKVYERLRHSRIPDLYRAAHLDRPEVIDWVKAPTEGLFLCGKPGTGKTFAACAALSHLARKSTVMFYSVDDLMRDVRATYDSREASEQDVMERAFNVGCLLLDDLGRDNLTAAALPRLFDIIDGRMNRGKPTIVTSNEPGHALRAKFAKFDAVSADALASRLSTYRVVLFDGPDRRRNRA